MAMLDDPDDRSGGKKKHWIKGAVKRPGAFTAKAKAAGVPVQKYASEKAHAKGRLGEEARFAKTMGRINRMK